MSSAPNAPSRLTRACLGLAVVALAGMPFGAGAAEVTDGPTAFAYLHRVATHPRCVNCHGRAEGKDDLPTVGDDLHRHPMNIKNAITQLGATCTTCHQKRNQDEEHLPPGAADDQAMPGFLWHMPPRMMQLATTMKPQELCGLWTDPARNATVAGQRGGMNDLPTLRTAFVEHVKNDPLVHWAFAPGPGRTAAPGDVEQLVNAMDVWIQWLQAGHLCSEL